MRRFFRISGILLLAVLAITATLAITLVLYNRTDDRLEPVVERLLAEFPDQIDADKNGFFAWIGVVGPDTVDPSEWGRRWFSEALAADRERVKPPLPIEAEIENQPAVKDDAICRKMEGCLASVLGNPESVSGEYEHTTTLLSPASVRWLDCTTTAGRGLP